LLPPEKCIKEEILSGSKLKNADFELARNQKLQNHSKHSMNIGGREKKLKLTNPI
jgi:hypothetical protein